ncbi:hypothetical protein GX50_07600 [[Emmonsia] crescens]|uniref:RING-type domain-containing protein n=1 Tax=[Emmonsia] crescens TaxID=73230 RepID=A0A2B7Z9F4_9EURO|nr:hypothetical protein GX50_07600 [Emmonsia crescens]
MGCSNSTQVREEPEADRIVVKPLDHYQISAPSTNSTLLPDFHSETLETTAQTILSLANKPASTADTDIYFDISAEEERGFDVAMMEITCEIFTEQFGNPDFVAACYTPGMFAEEEREFDVAMMEISNEIFTEQYGNPDSAAVVYTPDVPDEDKAEVVDECSICFQAVSGDEFLLTPCKTCPNHTCSNCIRNMFISACGDESRMPPRCCGPLNIGAAVSVLTSEELELFKNKHEEWTTANRVYCPVPICSVFIPYRLFPSNYRPTAKLAKPKVNENPPVPLGPTQLQTPPPTPPTSTPSPPPEPASISCPGCSIEICCTCKQLMHKGTPCSEGAGELDPELTALLEKWKIKRCPKCRGAVRLMYGCSHIACRCGDQWCWHCRQPIEECREHGCTYEGGEEEEDDDSDWEDGDNENQNEAGNNGGRNQTPPENLDLDRGGGRRWDNGSYAFGEEPLIEHYDPIDCYHNWIKAAPDDVNESQKYACEQCWRDIFPRPFTYPEVVELMEHGFISEKSIADGEDQKAFNLRLFMCGRCSIMLCDDCQAADTAEKVAGKRWERA